MDRPTSALPHWDVSGVYPSLDSPEFAAGFSDLGRQVEELERLFDDFGIRRLSDSVDTRTIVSTFDRVTTLFNQLLEQLVTIRGFIHAFVSTDAANNLAQAKMSELQGQMVRITHLRTRYDAWVGSLDLEALLAASDVARLHEYALAQAVLSSQHQMPEAEEDLAAQMSMSGGQAWAKLHGNYSSRLMVHLILDGDCQELPMSAVRNLASHPEESVRKAAYQAELSAWENAAVPLAAALNGVKGEAITLSKRRGWSGVLDQALFINHIDATTLEAMQSACLAAFPVFRRYLQVKAQALGKERLPWYDLFAPLPDAVESWPYEKGCQFIVEQFGVYSDRLADFAARAFRENWIDAEPRRGKRDGAFCMLIRPGESRVLTNYSGLSFSSVSTLAHELGHGYHNLCLAERTPMQRNTPMALAETASIFCQTLVTQAALQSAKPEEKRSIIEGDLKNACQVVVDIHSRFMFESRVLAARQKRELSVDELNEIMLEAQRETYGDGLDPQYLHPYMWAVKTHYYSVDRPFYNFPYTFGLLFGLGLYAQYKQDPETFRRGYDELLSSTGLADAAALASRFGIDIKTPAFWEGSLGVIACNVDEFARLGERSL